MKIFVIILVSFLIPRPASAAGDPAEFPVCIQAVGAELIDFETLAAKSAKNPADLILGAISPRWPAQDEIPAKPERVTLSDLLAYVNQRKIFPSAYHAGYVPAAVKERHFIEAHLSLIFAPGVPAETRLAFGQSLLGPRNFPRPVAHSDLGEAILYWQLARITKKLDYQKLIPELFASPVAFTPRFVERVRTLAGPALDDAEFFRLYLQSCPDREIQRDRKWSFLESWITPQIDAARSAGSFPPGFLAYALGNVSPDDYDQFISEDLLAGEPVLVRLAEAFMVNPALRRDVSVSEIGARDEKFAAWVKSLPEAKKRRRPRAG